MALPLWIRVKMAPANFKEFKVMRCIDSTGLDNLLDEERLYIVRVLPCGAVQPFLGYGKKLIVCSISRFSKQVRDQWNKS